MSLSVEKRFLVALMSFAAFLSFGVLAGTAEGKKPKPVSVFPAPKTPVASDSTTFSFRGLKPGNLGKVKVIGSKSGKHGHTRLRHSDGNGVSIVPKRQFVDGEKVRVYTKKRIKRARNGDFWVRIGRFYGLDDLPAGPGIPLPHDGLKSRPELKPLALDVLTSTPDASPGKIFYAPKADGLTIADNSGRISWFRPTGFGGKGDQVYNFQTQTYNGKPVLTYWKGASSARGFSQVGEFEILNNKYNRLARFGPGNGYRANIHEFEISPRSTALVSAYRGVLWDASHRPGGTKDTKVMDNIIQEVDIETGAVLFEWHSLGNVDVAASGNVSPPDDGAVWDYFHVNAVKADGDSVLVSARRTSSIYRIDRKTARTRWRLRGDSMKPKTNDFEIGPGAQFGYQHDIERLPNGDISLFDNGVQGGLPTVNPDSSILVLKLSRDGENRTASLVARYNHPEAIVANSQGSARLLANGNWFAGWGSVKRMTEFTPTGEVAFDATFNDADISSYRAFKAPWEGFPKDRPSIASEADGDGAKVYASWNGATKVRSWKVFTGANSNSLTQVGTSTWKNLETMIPIATVESKVRVVAYDDEGKKLGQSGLIPLGQQSR